MHPLYLLLLYSKDLLSEKNKGRNLCAGHPRKSDHSPRFLDMENHLNLNSQSLKVLIARSRSRFLPTDITSAASSAFYLFKRETLQFSLVSLHPGTGNHIGAGTKEEHIQQIFTRPTSQGHMVEVDGNEICGLASDNLTRGETQRARAH
jgi:hypothetical protein